MSSTAAAIAARLKLKRKAPPVAADEPPPPATANAESPPAAKAEPPPAAPPPAAPPPALYPDGATVFGNFKGMYLADEEWDEALVVGRNPDGTYALEYVDEGLIEDAVPASRIRLSAEPDGAGGVDDGDVDDAPGDLTFVEGETVMGNFKDLGDWDEALVVGKNADGTYTLEYVDEGLLEERVPASRIAKSGGMDAEAAAGISLAVAEDDEAPPEAARPPPRELEAVPPRGRVDEEDEASDDEGEEEEDDDEEEEEEDPLSSTADFAPCRQWRGPKRGCCFKMGEQGVGYYVDVPLLQKAEEAERASIVLTAPQLANWAVEMLAMPPSVDKVDKYMGLWELPTLRVQALSGGGSKGAGAKPAGAKPAGGSSPMLFASLGEWFSSQLPILAQRVPSRALEVTLRVFLAPQQSVRQGLEHVTFSVDWVRVTRAEGAADEPLSRALLTRMGLLARNPPKMLLVVMYRAEKNRITHVWADVDREGLGAKKGATLDDVLLSDIFDTCLTLARKQGAVGSLDPLFYNYYQAAVVGG